MVNIIMLIFITIISYSVDVVAVFPGHSAKLSTHLHLIHRLGAQGARSITHAYSFTVCYLNMPRDSWRTKYQLGVTIWGGIRVAGFTPISHTETPTHIETRIHNKCDDTIEKSQAPDDGCINVRNMLSIEEVK